MILCMVFLLGFMLLGPYCILSIKSLIAGFLTYCITSLKVIACLDVRTNDKGDLVVTKGDQYDVREHTKENEVI